MAKTKSLYMIVDLPNNHAVLKARGITLRTFPLQAIEWIGSPFGRPLSLHLKVKDPMISPLLISPPPVSNKTAQADGEEEPLSQNPPPATGKVVGLNDHHKVVVENQIVSKRHIRNRQGHCRRWILG